jgi:hypothetical protein
VVLFLLTIQEAHERARKEHPMGRRKSPPQSRTRTSPSGKREQTLTIKDTVGITFHEEKDPPTVGSTVQLRVGRNRPLSLLVRHIKRRKDGRYVVWCFTQNGEGRELAKHRHKEARITY